MLSIHKLHLLIHATSVCTRYCGTVAAQIVRHTTFTIVRRRRFLLRHLTFLTLVTLIYFLDEEKANFSLLFVPISDVRSPSDRKGAPASTLTRSSNSVLWVKSEPDDDCLFRVPFVIQTFVSKTVSKIFHKSTLVKLFSRSFCSSSDPQTPFRLFAPHKSVSTSISTSLLFCS